jgi:hypothetical protein
VRSLTVLERRDREVGGGRQYGRWNSSRANEVPAPVHGTPSSSATVAPTSAKLSRVGIGRGTTPGPGDEQQAVLAGVVGAVPGGVVAVVADQHEHVVGAQRGAQLGQARVERGQRRRVAVRVAAVAVDRVEADQVGEHEAVDAARAAPRSCGRRRPSSSRRGHRAGDAARPA